MWLASYPSRTRSQRRVVLGAENAWFDANGRQAGDVLQIVGALLDDVRVAETLSREADDSNTFFTAVVDRPAFRPTLRQVFIKRLEPSILMPLAAVEIRGRCRMMRARFQMVHGVLGPVRVSWGSSVLGGEKATLVAVRPEGAMLKLTLHLAEPPRAPTSDT